MPELNRPIVSTAPQDVIFPIEEPRPMIVWSVRREDTNRLRDQDHAVFVLLEDSTRILDKELSTLVSAHSRCSEREDIMHCSLTVQVGCAP